MSAQRTFNYRKKQQGFTLIELLVVVSVLAAMAGIAAIAMDGYEQNAQKQLVKTEMKRIGSAIHHFARDTGHYPRTGVFDDPVGNSNFEWLFVAPEFDSDGDNIVDKTMGWNPNVSIGWNGPYLTLDSQQHFLAANCDLAVPVDPDNLEISLADVFEQKNRDEETCFTVFDKGNWVKKDFSGTEYRYELAFNMNWHLQCKGTTNCIVLRSAGPDGIFAVTADTNSDDIVNVLKVNN